MNRRSRQEMAAGGSSPAISGRQERSLQRLLAEPTIEAAAKAAHVGERTLYRWLREPAFQEAYREARTEAVRLATARLQRTAGEAVTTLATIIGDGTAPHSARVSAARTVLDLTYRAVELEDLESRLQRLEEREANGP